LQKLPLIMMIVCFALAVVIFVFASGARRIYSGLFFTVIGAVMAVNLWRWRRT